MLRDEDPSGTGIRGDRAPETLGAGDPEERAGRAGAASPADLSCPSRRPVGPGHVAHLAQVRRGRTPFPGSQVTPGRSGGGEAATPPWRDPGPRPSPGSQPRSRPAAAACSVFSPAGPPVPGLGGAAGRDRQGGTGPAPPPPPPLFTPGIATVSSPSPPRRGCPGCRPPAKTGFFSVCPGPLPRQAPSGRLSRPLTQDWGTDPPPATSCPLAVVVLSALSLPSALGPSLLSPWGAGVGRSFPKAEDGGVRSPWPLLGSAWLSRAEK